MRSEFVGGSWVWHPSYGFLPKLCGPGGVQLGESDHSANFTNYCEPLSGSVLLMITTSVAAIIKIDL